MNDRTANLLGNLTKRDRLIEVGPSYNPLAPKRSGYRTTVVDHASRPELISKYTNHPGVDFTNIEEVDVIWRDGSLHDAFDPETHGTFTGLLASHVLEHLPNPIGFLEFAAKLLDPERGLLSLALPDRRWCFDAFRPLSTTGKMLAAHREGAARHSPTTLFESAAYLVLNNGRLAWGREPATALRFDQPLEAAQHLFDTASTSPDSAYIDCHGWQFTPSSFELLILELGALDVADWHIAWIEPQPQVEFLVHLRRGAKRFESAAARDERRLDLLRETMRELREQTDWLVPRTAEALSLPPSAESTPLQRTWRALAPAGLRRTLARLRAHS